MRMFKKEEGFTLVELMVVVLIIGILVAIAIPVFNAAQDSARKSACQNNLRVLDGATEQWAAADPDNDKDSLDGTPAAVDTASTTSPNAGPAISTYVQRYTENATLCPTDSTAYSCENGNWTCSVSADHNYEN